MDHEGYRQTNALLIQDYISALSSGDFSKISFSAEVSLFTPFMEVPVKGVSDVVDALKDISSGIDDIRIVRMVTDKDFACAILEFKSKTGATISMCDTYMISGGKLVEICPYFDPRPLLGNQ